MKYAFRIHEADHHGKDASKHGRLIFSVVDQERAERIGVPTTVPEEDEQQVRAVLEALVESAKEAERDKRAAALRELDE